MSRPSENKAAGAARTKRSDVLDMETYIPHLVSRAHIKLTRKAEAGFKVLGLTIAKWRVIHALMQHGPMKVGELTAAVHLEPTTVSRAIDNLEVEGQATRTRLQDDARAVEVALTAPGTALWRRTVRWAQEHEKDATRGLSETEVKTLRSLLAKLSENLGTQPEYRELSKGRPKTRK